MRPRADEPASDSPSTAHDTMPALARGVSCPAPSEPRGRSEGPRASAPELSARAGVDLAHEAARTSSERARAEHATLRSLDTRGLRAPADDVVAPASSRTPRIEPASSPPGSSPPSRRDPRPALRVDDVGAAAVRLASRVGHDATPRVLVQRRVLASAPIDHREAFLVSLLDGKLTVAGLVDVSGMREAEVVGALQRLVRLGIVAL